MHIKWLLCHKEETLVRMRSCTPFKKVDLESLIDPLTDVKEGGAEPKAHRIE